MTGLYTRVICASSNSLSIKITKEIHLKGKIANMTIESSLMSTILEIDWPKGLHQNFMQMFKTKLEKIKIKRIKLAFI